MGLFTERGDHAGIAGTVGKVADGFSRLVTQHLALAQVELAEDARAVGGELGRLAAFVPFLLVGHALLSCALALALSRWLGLQGALWVVGGGNLLVGIVGAVHAVGRLKDRKVLGRTREELQRSAAVLGEASNGR